MKGLSDFSSNIWIYWWIYCCNSILHVMIWCMQPVQIQNKQDYQHLLFGPQKWNKLNSKARDLYVLFSFLKYNLSKTCSNYVQSCSQLSMKFQSPNHFSISLLFPNFLLKCIQLVFSMICASLVFDIDSITFHLYHIWHLFRPNNQKVVGLPISTCLIALKF